MKKLVLKFSLLFASCFSLLAQTPPNMSGLTSSVKSSLNGVGDLVSIIIGVIILIGLVSVIYQISNGKHEAKEKLVGWIVALVLWGVGYAILKSAGVI